MSMLFPNRLNRISFFDLFRSLVVRPFHDLILLFPQHPQTHFLFQVCLSLYKYGRLNLGTGKRTQYWLKYAVVFVELQE